MDESIEAPPAAAGSLAGAAAAAAHYFHSNALTSVDTISRATSPGLPPSRAPDEDGKKRYRPRTFSYFRLLPYPVEEDAERDAALAGILKNLFIAIKAEDFSPGALHWTRELQGWLNLKFEMTRELRAKLAQVYYHLSLAPGLDANAADRATKMLITLTRYAANPINGGSGHSSELDRPLLLTRYARFSAALGRSTTSSPARI